MKKKSLADSQLQTRRLALFAMLLGVELLLLFTPLGFVPLGPVNATTLHIPVLLAAILLGPKAGAGMGLVFGISSLIKNTVAPTITSFVFTPFYKLGTYSGNGWSVWIAIGPRILLGLIAAGLFRLFVKQLKKPTLAAGLAAGISTFLHTFMVMGSIYLFFGPSYAQARNITESALLSVIGTVIFVNSIGEIILATLICMGVYRIVAKKYALDKPVEAEAVKNVDHDTADGILQKKAETETETKA